MSHFVVTVFVEGSRASTAEEAVEIAKDMLSPYQENNCGDCPKEFLFFHDMQEELEKEYSEAKIKVVKLEDGTIDGFPYDSKYDISNSIEAFFPKRKYPDNSKIEQVLIKEVFASFDKFATEYSGYQKDPEEDSYGYWENPNAKWDWFEVGGRWSGYIPVKNNLSLGKDVIINKPDTGIIDDTSTRFVDVAKIEHIDFDYISYKSNVELLNAWDKWLQFVETKKDPDSSFWGFRSTCLSLVLIRVIKSKEEYDLLSDQEKKNTVEWANNYNGNMPIDSTDNRKYYYDVFTSNVSKEEFLTRFAASFFPIKPYAYLTKEGWVEPGEAGWWGMSLTTSDSEIEHAENFIKYLFSQPKDTWLVIVDCHI